MSMLDRKLGRDLVRMWAQALALGKPVDNLIPPLVTTIALVAVAYVAALLSFRRQEL